jgi:hypothetical protein
MYRYYAVCLGADGADGAVQLTEKVARNRDYTQHIDQG